ncbi:MAG: hypothetical protein M3Y29_00195 [Chloroflexota bacterium]|nr:hypothetical protein [Chloroflexota bacterium]
MSRGTRIAALLAGVLVVAIAGTVLATRQPSSAQQPAQVTQDGEDEAPSAEKVAQVAERLGVTAELLSGLAAEHGFGGAVRLVAWSSETGRSIEDLEAMRAGDGTEEGAVGWGKMAKDLGVHPGIGSIMGNGGGHGREDAPGQNRDEDADSGG